MTLRQTCIVYWESALTDGVFINNTPPLVDTPKSSEPALIDADAVDAHTIRQRFFGLLESPNMVRSVSIDDKSFVTRRRAVASPRLILMPANAVAEEVESASSTSVDGFSPNGWAAPLWVEWLTSIDLSPSASTFQGSHDGLVPKGTTGQVDRTETSANTVGRFVLLKGIVDDPVRAA